MDQNATNSAPADSSSAGGNEDTGEDFEAYASRMDAGGDDAGSTSTRVPAQQGAAQGDQGDQGQAQGQGDQAQGQVQQGDQGQGKGEDRRPWKRILAANAAARNSEAARRAAELEAENARLRQLVGGTPAPAGTHGAQAPAAAQAPAPGPKPKPREEDFIDPATGKFDGQAYLDARDEWRDAERVRIEQENATRQAQERLQEDEEKHARTVNASFWGKAAQMAEEIPDAMETLQGMSHPDIAGRIPPKVQIALLEADPLVMYAIAHRDDLLASVMSGDVAGSLRLVGHLEGLLAQYQNQQGAESGTPAGAGQQQQQAAGPSLMAPQGAPQGVQPARNTSGQFVAGMPATPPRPQPRAPVDLGGSGSRPASLLDGDDFEAYAEEQDRKARRR